MHKPNFFERLFNVRINITRVEKPKQPNSLFFKPFPMRWYDTCSCMAVKLPETLVHGLVVRTYAVEYQDGGMVKKEFSSLILGKVLAKRPWSVEEWWECKLDNGKTLDRPKRSFFKGHDGIYEYHN